MVFQNIASDDYSDYSIKTIIMAFENIDSED